MDVQELKAIITKMDAKGTLPVRARVNFGEGPKSYTVADIESFHQWSDGFQLNCAVEFPEVDKLMELREWLASETERFQEQSKAPNASPEGSHYDRGHASAFIMVRDRLEKLFNYWDCR